MEVTLLRDVYSSQATEGRLIIGDTILYTLEEPWRGNLRSVSCIPKGKYKVVPHNWADRKGLRFSRVWHITNVPNRDAILIHTGNTTADIEGCVLVGLTRGKIGRVPAVMQSRLAISKMRDIIGQNGFTLTIEDSV